MLEIGSTTSPCYWVFVYPPSLNYSIEAQYLRKIIYSSEFFSKNIIIEMLKISCDCWELAFSQELSWFWMEKPDPPLMFFFIGSM